VSEHHFTLGAGWAMNDQFTLQVTGMYSPESKLTGSNGGPPQNGGQMISSYTTKMSQLQFDVGASYRF
jgi:hypothetical protein